MTSSTSRPVVSATSRALFAMSPKPPYFSGPKTYNARYAPEVHQFQMGTFLPVISRTNCRIGRCSYLLWSSQSINSIQETKTEKSYVCDHGCGTNCRGYIITGGHGPNTFAEYKFTVIIGEGLDGDRHKFGHMKPLATNVNQSMKGSWRWVNDDRHRVTKNNNTYRSRLRIPSFSSSSSFDRLYLSHSAVIFSSKSPKVMNVTTISGRSWTALQATPQSGRIHPVIDRITISWITDVYLGNEPHNGSVTKTRCPFRPWSESISERIYVLPNWTISVSQEEDCSSRSTPHFRTTLMGNGILITHRNSNTFIRWA